MQFQHLKGIYKLLIPIHLKGSKLHKHFALLPSLSPFHPLLPIHMGKAQPAERSPAPSAAPNILQQNLTTKSSSLKGAVWNWFRGWTELSMRMITLYFPASSCSDFCCYYICARKRQKSFSSNITTWFFLQSQTAQNLFNFGKRLAVYTKKQNHGASRC